MSSPGGSQKTSRQSKNLEFFNDRREMFWYFQERMTRSYRRYAERGESNSLVKTFFLEYDGAQVGGRIDKEHVRAALTIPATSKKQAPLVPEVRSTDDSGFFVVTWNGRDGIRVFLDVAAEERRRFWTCYSLSDAARLDLFVDRLAYRQPKVDRIWLWPAMLSNTQDLGEFRGVGIDYDKRRLDRKEPEAGESTSYFKFQIWGGPSTRLFLDAAQNNSEFRQQAVLSKVRLKYSLSEDPDKFALEEVKFNGKLTARGPDFHAHQALVATVRDKYKAKVLDIESRYAISVPIEGTRHGVKGEPLFFNLQSCPIDDLDMFCDVIFSGGPPFHIWGVTDKVGTHDTGRVVHAVDMHTGSKLLFEIYSDLVAMYLYTGGCGNTAIRFFTNLQRMFGALVRGEDNGGRDIFQ